MAITISHSSIFLSACLLSLCLLCSAIKGYPDTHNTHTIRLSFLLPSSVCNPSTKATERNSSLKVVHKHGPCFQPNGDKAIKSPFHAQILLQDQSRVNSIHSRLSKTSSHGDVEETEAATLPAKDGSVVGSGNYIVTVGLGSPKKDLSLIFDTGSDLTWTQCQPCSRHCHKQEETIFDPRLSKTYANISCSSTLCSSPSSAIGLQKFCEDSACSYRIEYADSAFSAGFLGKETLTLTSSDVFPNFCFGCGQNNEASDNTAGLIGLGRDKLSLVSQTAQKYKKIFSYCLPSSASSTGHLTFGDAGNFNSVKYTPLSSISQKTSLWGIDITAIAVGGKALSISPTVFSTAGAVIDSGGVITRLPPAAYSALRTAFRQGMTRYPRVPALLPFDTCYDLSKDTTVSVPQISFSFNGGVVVHLNYTGSMYVNSPSQVCLAFAANSKSTDVAIFGNVQQKTMEVVYDAAGGRVGFAPGGCS